MTSVLKITQYSNVLHTRERIWSDIVISQGKGSVAHGAEQLIVVCGTLHAVFDKFHSLY